MTTIGQLLAVGRTSDVYAYGHDSVVKVPRSDVPAHWSEMEAQFTSSVRQLGAPAPDVHDLVDIEGRTSIVFERVDGESMWQRMLDAPGDVGSLSHELVSVHRHILSIGLPPGVDSIVDRMCRKIDEAEQLPAHDRDEAKRILSGLPNGAALLHGDLHPGNVLMRHGEPIVIDWFDAAIGHPVTDVVRSSLLIRPHETERPHLPDAPPDLLDRLHRCYVSGMADLLEMPAELLRRWECVVAASRLAERAETDESSLLRLWNDRAVDEPSPLLEAVSVAADQ